MKIKKTALAALLLATLFTLSGCLIQPDPTLDPLVIDGATEQQLPFSTTAPLKSVEPTVAPVTPEPTVNDWTPSDSSQWEDWSAGSSVTQVTTKPTATPANVTPTKAPSSWQTSTEDYNTGYPVLKMGSTGSDVSDLQTQLKSLGYYTGTIDGMYSTGTQSSVESFQQQNGLTADGIAGRATQDKLYSSSAVAKSISANATSATYALLQNGSYGTDVRMLQVRLSELGYYAGGADGVFGTSTENAVKTFQRTNSLSADGQAGEATQKKLYSASAKSASSPVKTPDPNQTRTLTVGMEGNDVYSVQERLIELGYLNGVADGVFGVETQTAVTAFQKRNNITADGQVGSVTLKRINGSAKPAANASATSAPASGTIVTLREGSSGEEVYNLQARLYELGYYSGRIDGRFGLTTTAAVVSFQAKNGLTADGIAGVGTQNMLNSASAINNLGGGGSTIWSSTPVPQITATPSPGASLTELSQGSTGELVRLLQQNLKNLGYYSGSVDGDYGSSTASAVRLFQERNGLKADGIAGSGTLEVLYSGISVSNSTPGPSPAPTPTTYTALSKGMKGDDVRFMQQRLAGLGYLTNAQVDGDYGSTTVNAVKSFQELNHLNADGVASASSLVVLYSTNAVAYSSGGSSGGDDGGTDSGGASSITRTLREGDSGDDVAVLQRRLSQLGFYSGSIDGQMGAGTVSALKRFQERNGLSSDGIAGSGTVAVLFEDAANGYAPETVGEVTSISTSNASRDKKERNINGAYQMSLSGGGIVTNDKSKLFFANATEGGALSSRALNGGSSTRLSSDIPRFLHATNGRLYYVSTSDGKDCIIRLNIDDGDRRIALSVGTIQKFVLHNGVFIYQDQSGSIYTRDPEISSQHLFEGANDFIIDALSDTLYAASDGGVYRVNIISGDSEQMTDRSASQVTVCGDAVYFLSSGNIYRTYKNNTELIFSGACTWVAGYGSNLYYLENGMIYRCDVNGKNSQLIDGGSGYTRVSIADNVVYVGTAKGFSTMINL